MNQPYITFRELDADGRLCFYVLQKQFPHYLGIISSGEIQFALVNMPIPSYNLYISYKGCLQGNFVPGYKDVIPDIVSEFINMADWYYQNRIKENPKRYLKFKIVK